METLNLPNMIRVMHFGWNGLGQIPAQWDGKAELNTNGDVTAWLLGWANSTSMLKLRTLGLYKLPELRRCVWVLQDPDFRKELSDRNTTWSVVPHVNRAVSLLEDGEWEHIVITIDPAFAIEEFQHARVEFPPSNIVKPLMKTCVGGRTIEPLSFEEIQQLEKRGAIISDAGNIHFGHQVFSLFGLRRYANAYWDCSADDKEGTSNQFGLALDALLRCEDCAAPGQRFNHDLNGCSSGEDPHIQTVKTALRTMVYHPTNLQVDANPKAAKVISQWAELMEKYPDAGLAWLIATIRHCDPVFLQKLGEMLARENDTPPLVN